MRINAGHTLSHLLGQHLSWARCQGATEALVYALGGNDLSAGFVSQPSDNILLRVDQLTL